MALHGSDLAISGETLFVSIGFWLATTPPPLEPAQTAARALVGERYDALVAVFIPGLLRFRVRAGRFARMGIASNSETDLSTLLPVVIAPAFAIGKPAAAVCTLADHVAANALTGDDGECLRLAAASWQKILVAGWLGDTTYLVNAYGRPNTRHAGMIRFSGNDQVEQREPVIPSYLREAMFHAQAGINPPKEPGEIDLPEELLEALDTDPELAEGFQKLTPGRQKSYVIQLNAAKTSATRTARVIKFRPHILAGKGALER